MSCGQLYDVQEHRQKDSITLGHARPNRLPNKGNGMQHHLITAHISCTVWCCH
uniref:Uncharacterized protein n=1 Tax=Arion vulgaris TaxID=1028688 RepID=A0A0B7BRT1_9EUPU